MTEKKLSHFGQKYRLMNGVTASFNTTMVQRTEISQKNDRNVFSETISSWLTNSKTTKQSARQLAASKIKKHSTALACMNTGKCFNTVAQWLIEAWRSKKSKRHRFIGRTEHYAAATSKCQWWCSLLQNQVRKHNIAQSRQRSGDIVERHTHISQTQVVECDHRNKANRYRQDFPWKLLVKSETTNVTNYLRNMQQVSTVQYFEPKSLADTFIAKIQGRH